MKCTLMHKNYPVVEITISEYSGSIESHGTVHDPARLPVGTTMASGVNKGKIVPFAFNEWWSGRCIPASRDGIRDALQTLDIPSTIILISKCYALSLSDQYWICPKGSGLRWETINFFQNDFSKDIGEILFGHQPADITHVSLVSPDNTSDGWLRKKWIIADGKRFLMKGGSGVFMQEPFNEVIATAIMRRLGISHVPYTLSMENRKPYSLCENFITPDTELVPAWRILRTIKKDNRDSNLMHMLRCAETLGIPGVRAAMDRMLTLDYIISNEDRHYNNFGFIRNVDTLEWLGQAPVFDSGTSLWHNTPHVGSAVESKPFRSKHSEQIKLVADLSWFDADALAGLYDEIIEIFAPSDRLDDKRRTEIASAVAERCDRI